MIRGKLTEARDSRICSLETACGWDSSLGPQTAWDSSVLLFMSGFICTQWSGAEPQSSLFPYWLCLACLYMSGARESFAMVRYEWFPCCSWSRGSLWALTGWGTLRRITRRDTLVYSKPWVPVLMFCSFRCSLCQTLCPCWTHTPGLWSSNKDRVGALERKQKT